MDEEEKLVYKKRSHIAFYIIISSSYYFIRAREIGLPEDINPILNNDIIFLIIILLFISSFLYIMFIGFKNWITVIRHIDEQDEFTDKFHAFFYPGVMV